MNKKAIVSLAAALIAGPFITNAAVVLDSAKVSWTYNATDKLLGFVGQGTSLGYVDVTGSVSEGAGPNLDPTATSIGVYSTTTTDPGNLVQGIISDEGGGVDGGIALLWYATIVDRANPTLTGPVDIRISGAYSLGIDGPGTDFNGAFDSTDGFAFLNASALVTVGGAPLFSYKKSIGNDLACLPYGDPSLCEITVSAFDSISVDATVALNSVIRLDLSAFLSLAGSGEGNYGARARADPSIAFKNVADAERYQILFSPNLDSSVPSPVPEPSGFLLVATALGLAAATRRRRSE